MADEMERSSSTSQRVQLTGKNISKSCLILQIAIYFNVYFSPMYFVTFYLSYQRLSKELNEMEAYLFVVASIFGCFIELNRLILGYSGNYCHNVPRILCFWLMSVAIQLPLQIMMKANPLTTKPFLAAINNIMILFLIIEIIAGFAVLHWLILIIPKLKKH